MILEVLATAALGALLVWLAFGGAPDPAAAGYVDPDPLEETPRGRALLAIKELEFDRETGKIADDDYRDLKERLSRAAMSVLETDPPPPIATAPRPEPAPSPWPSCPRCGPCPEPSARFCSRCGGPVPAAA